MKQLLTILSITSFFTLLSLSAYNQDTTVTQQVSTSSNTAKSNDFTVNSTSNEAVTAFNEGLHWSDIGDDKKARTFLQTAIDRDANLAVAYMYKALAQPTFEGYATALQQAKEHLATAGDWDKLFYTLLETRLTDDVAKRMATAQEMVTKFPNIARSYHELGNAYSDRDEIDKARTAYMKAIELSPSWISGHYDIAQSYLNRDPKDLKQAETHAQHAVSLAPTSASPNILLGDVYRAQSQWDKAAACYSKAIQLDPKMPTAYIKRGHVNNFAGKYDEARKDYKLANEYDEEAPMSAMPYIAYTYAYQGQLPQAIKMLQDEATKLGSSTTKGKTDLQFGLLQSAAYMAFHNMDAKSLNAVVDQWEPVYKELAQKVGTDEMSRYQQAEMLYWRGLADVLNGNYDKAKANAEEIKKTVDPISNPHKLDNYHSLLGQIAFHKKEYKQAVTEFDQTNPTDTYAKYWRAKAYEKAGQKDKAKMLYKELANYNFNDIGNALVRTEVKKNTMGK
ncbi:tetratricopeptide repeat protein [Flavisolibacter tropicus]|uniref:Uncharacterized protein n=1 Tax=Flavisolibacter tropicus TaxID=1492898 RepID=A0A172TW60_9BACT|nr:tetratricopeptide repeat protein [Flavisolibacter tropicus]ANE51315.1 hypothetical protein SY85_13135 [Flavisolibacter tropicus]